MTSQKPFQVDRNSSVPLHRQVEQWLRLQIETGALSPGDTLPPRKEFCEMLGGINHLTIRQAVNALIRDGLLYTVQGRGTFVANKEDAPFSVALVLPTIEAGITREILNGVDECFESPQEKDLPRSRVVLFDSRRDIQKEINNIAHLEDLPLDGAIIMPLCHGDLVEHLLRLKSDKFPLVLVDSVIEGIEFSSVTSDHYSGGYQAAEHLLKRGRKNLAWIGNCRGFFSVRRRLEGVRDAINDAGMCYNRKWQFDYDAASPIAPFENCMREIVSRIVREKMPIDAIVCGSAPEAITCMGMLQELDVPIPGQIAVVGFDDLEETKTCVPPLTIVSQPMRQLGREAARLLLEIMQNPSITPQKIVLPVHLIERGSS